MCGLLVSIIGGECVEEGVPVSADGCWRSPGRGGVCQRAGGHRRGAKQGHGPNAADCRLKSFCRQNKIIQYWSGIYIMQNTMVRGGGNGQQGKKIKLGVRGKN